MGQFKKKAMDNADFAREFFDSLGRPEENQVGGEHYKSKEIQPWEYMECIMSESEFTGYLWGNIIKYMSRWQEKGGRQDLEKAQHYLSKLLNHV